MLVAVEAVFGVELVDQVDHLLVAQVDQRPVDSVHHQRTEVQVVEVLPMLTVVVELEVAV
jgi:hypothetical protein